VTPDTLGNFRERYTVIGIWENYQANNSQKKAIMAQPIGKR
jgi:hypothetical protein